MPAMLQPHWAGLCELWQSFHVQYLSDCKLAIDQQVLAEDFPKRSRQPLLESVGGVAARRVALAVCCVMKQE
jgi:hypothetical protein